MSASVIGDIALGTGEEKKLRGPTLLFIRMLMKSCIDRASSRLGIFSKPNDESNDDDILMPVIDFVQIIEKLENAQTDLYDGPLDLGPHSRIPFALRCQQVYDIVDAELRLAECFRMEPWTWEFMAPKDRQEKTFNS